MARLSRIRFVHMALPILLLFFWLAINSLVGDSPTMDEQNHLARGIAFLKTGDARLSLEHPPLVNSLSALPLLTLPDIQLPTDHPSWQQREGWYAFAEQLLWIYNQDVERMVFLARIPVVFLTIGLGLIGFSFARELWGRWAALLTLFFLLYDPNILAHGRYATTDVGGAAMVLLAAYLFWRLWSLEQWHWGRLLAAGLGLGLALSTKLSNLIFLLIFAVLAIIPIYSYGWKRVTVIRRILQYGIACFFAIVFVWSTFGFEWRSYRFLAEPFSSLNSFSGPLPTFTVGIEQIFQLSGGGRPAFLLGEFSVDGWWYYFPVAFSVKTPILVIFLFLLATILLLSGKTTRKRAIYLLFPSAAFFLASMISALNIGYRHLLPMLPFLYVMASGLTVLPEVIGKPVSLKQRLARFSLGGAVISIILIDLVLHPHYLSYFNFIAGGPANGHKILVDSNLDWGQDLFRLQSWMAENDVDRIKLSWFGTADPDYYGLDYEPLPGLTRHFDLWWDVPFDPAEPAPGIYAISVSNLWEIPLDEKRVFPWFRAREPDDRIGYSILIYEVGDDDKAG